MWNISTGLAGLFIISSCLFSCTSSPEAKAKQSLEPKASAEPHAKSSPGQAAKVAKTLPPGALSVEEALGRGASFGKYWYMGLAELSRYELDQARYGEQHPGEAVLVFVTEDFRTDRQVKYEGGDRAGVESALKLNAYKRFYTGIYPYTIMTSVYSPAKGGPAWKVTNTVQEWCGQTFTQLNLREDGLKVLLRSYFQAEGDQELSLAAGAIKEDELWVSARIEPERLPQGELDVVPATQALRLQHEPIKTYKAKATLARVASGELYGKPHWVYTLSYEGLARSLRLYIEEAFPHRIVAWEEATRSSMDKAGAGERTRARLTDAMLLDYWARHGAQDGKYREALGVTF